MKKVTLTATVMEEHHGLVIVRLDDGFAGAVTPVSLDKVAEAHEMSAECWCKPVLDGEIVHHNLCKERA